MHQCMMVCDSIQRSLYMKTFILLNISHCCIKKMAVLNKKPTLWLWTNKKFNNSELRWIVSTSRSWKTGSWAIQDEIINDFWSSPLQRCPNVAKHATCVPLPFATTPSVLQQKQDQWIDLMLHLIWSSDSAPLFQLLLSDKEMFHNTKCKPKDAFKIWNFILYSYTIV